MSNFTVKIALPGDPGDSCDFLDLFLAEGEQAVIDCLDAAKLFQPTMDELEKRNSDQRRVSKLEKIHAQYPLPDIEGFDLEYRHSEKDGAIKMYEVVGREDDPETGKNKPSEWRLLMTPFGIPFRLRFADKDDAYGLRVIVQDMKRQPRAIDFERAGLAKMGASEIRAELYAGGLRTYSDGEAYAVQFLKGADPDLEIAVVTKPGWHRRAGEAPYYMTPGGKALGLGDHPNIEMATGIAIEHAAAGTLAGQIEAIDAALRAENTPHWHLGAAAGGVGPILDLMGDDSCGLCLSGASSVGKTIAQRMAASWWGSPKMGDGLLKPLRTTDNALEALAQSANGSILALDELGHADAKAVPAMLYLLAGGQGKARLTKSSTQRQAYAWRTFGLLSSETGLRSKVEVGGGSWMAGMSVRVPDITVTGVNAAVPGETIQAMEDGLATNHGHIGPAFIQKMIDEGIHENPDRLRDQVKRISRQIAGGDGIDARAARPFALILCAGIMAKKWALLPALLDIEGAVRWAWNSFQASSEAQALNPEEQAFSNLQAWIHSRWGVTIKPIDPAPDAFGKLPENNREAVGWYDGDCVYIPKATLIKASGNVLPENALAKAINTRDGLAKTKGERLYVQYVPKIGHVDAYALCFKKFGKAAKSNDLGVIDGGKA